MKKLSLFVIALFLFDRCTYNDINQPQTTPFNFPATPYNYSGEGANNYIPTLGRALFYDPRVSKNNSIACASCHIQAFAFTDSAQFSLGFDGKRTTRNSMPLQNLNEPSFSSDSGYGNTLAFFWDGRVNSLFEQVLMPITNHDEMGMDVETLVSKFNQYPEYKPLFLNAFGETTVTKERIATALTEFLASIKSNKSKFDLYQNGKAELTAEEKAGMELFMSAYNCNSCHQVTMLNGYMQGGGFADIGIDEIPKDKGRGNITGQASDIGKFKIPTLRNIELTAPYMHDGSHKTLEEVIDHYSQDINNSANLDLRLKKGNAPIHLEILPEEKKALVAFLKTLTDHEMVNDPKFSSPFK
jgi:cytochrome c peroxidase